MHNHKINNTTWKLGPSVVLIGSYDNSTERLLFNLEMEIKEWAFNRGYVLHPDRIHRFFEAGSQDYLKNIMGLIDNDTIIVFLPSLEERNISLEEDRYEN